MTRLVTSLSILAVSCLFTIILSKSNEQLQPYKLDVSRINTKEGDTLKPLLVPRPPGSPAHAKVQEQLRAWYREIGWQEEIYRFTAQTPKGPIEMANLVFTEPHGVNVTERVILSAHYESKLKALDSKQEGIFVGATDSAVPCAMIVELSRALTGTSERSFAFQAVFFDGEEAFENWTNTDSLYGSRHLADVWEKENKLKNIRLFILFDLLGAARPRIPNYAQSTDRYFKQLVEIEAKHRAKGFSFFHYIDRVGDNVFIADDHLPFHQRGLRNILHIIPSPFPTVWHRLADNGDAIDPQTVTDLTEIFYEFLKNLK